MKRRRFIQSIVGLIAGMVAPRPVEITPSTAYTPRTELGEVRVIGFQYEGSDGECEAYDKWLCSEEEAINLYRSSRP